MSELNFKNELSHHICGIVHYREFFYYNNTLCNHFPNKMYYDVNMFNPLMKHLIFNQMSFGYHNTQ